MLNKHQAIILVCICSIATKLQRFPSILSLTAGRDGWIVLLIFGLIDILGLILALWFLNKFNSVGTIYEILKSTYGVVFTKIIWFIMFAFFVITAVLPFVAIHDLFANILFTQLDYALFGLLFLVVIIFMATQGLTNIGRQSEIYAALIVISAVAVLLLGAFTCDYENILPILKTDESLIIKSLAQCSLWYGDFFIVFLLCGRIKLYKPDKLWFKLLIPYGLIVLIYIPFFYVVFYSLYGNLSGFQTSGISSITQFSLLTLDIGRIDWMFVLFEQISTISSSVVYIYLACTCFCEVFNIKKVKIIIAILSILLFIFDIVFFRDVNSAELLYHQLFYGFCGLVILILPILFVCAGMMLNKKDRRQYGRN